MENCFLTATFPYYIVKFVCNRIFIDAQIQPPPQHIAIIMDGNGRWAKAKQLPRSSGHQKGVQAVRKIVKLETLTEYKFIYSISLLTS